MKHTAKTLALFLATLLLLTSCRQNPSSAEETTAAVTDDGGAVKKEVMTPSLIKNKILSAENILLSLDSRITQDSQTREVTVKRAGTKVMMEEKTSYKEGNFTYYLTSTTYYDLEKNEIYQHDKDGNFFVTQMEETFDWEEMLSSNGILMSKYGSVFEDDNYVWIEGGKYIAPVDVLEKLGEQMGKSYRSMSMTCGSKNSAVTCSLEGESCELTASFINSTVEFPEAQRLEEGGISGI